MIADRRIEVYVPMADRLSEAGLYFRANWEAQALGCTRTGSGGVLGGDEYEISYDVPPSVCTQFLAKLDGLGIRYADLTKEKK